LLLPLAESILQVQRDQREVYVEQPEPAHLAKAWKSQTPLLLVLLLSMMDYSRQAWLRL